MRGNPTHPGLGTLKENSGYTYGLLSLSFNQNKKNTRIFGRTWLIINFIYHFTKQTVTIHKNKYTEYPKPHINNHKTPELQITELDSIRHIVAVSGTHLADAREPKPQSSM